MNICEATSRRIDELLKAKRLSGYKVCFNAGIPPSTYKSIIGGKSRNPGIVNIHKIAEGLGVSVREFYDSELFEGLDLDE